MSRTKMLKHIWHVACKIYSQCSPYFNYKTELHKPTFHVIFSFIFHLSLCTTLHFIFICIFHLFISFLLLFALSNYTRHNFLQDSCTAVEDAEECLKTYTSSIPQKKTGCSHSGSCLRNSRLMLQTFLILISTIKVQVT